MTTNCTSSVRSTGIVSVSGSSPAMGSNTLGQVQIQIHLFRNGQIQIQIQIRQISDCQIQIQFVKYKYKFQNVNLFSNIHPMIMLLTTYTTYYVKLCLHFYYCKFASFYHKSRQAYGMFKLCCWPMLCDEAWLLQFSELAMPYKMYI